MTRTASLAVFALHAVSVEAMCSVSTCEDLGWTESQDHRVDEHYEEHYGSPYVCGETNMMMGDISLEGAFLECSGYLNQASAEQFCENAGARLCTINELKNDEVRYTGCNYDNELVWSSSTVDSDTLTTCPAGQMLVVGGGSHTTSVSLVEVCKDVAESSSVVARCCADFGDSPTCPTAGGSCFHGNGTVLLESGASKRLADLEIGDRIKTSDEHGVFSFSPVVSLPHKANSEPAAFLSLKTETGKTVDMTSDHYIPMCDYKIVMAGDLVMGDCVLTMDGKETLVEITTTEKSGVYTAVTKNPFIVVDGIVASSFSKDSDTIKPEEQYAKYRLELEHLRKEKMKKAMLRGLKK